MNEYETLPEDGFHTNGGRPSHSRLAALGAALAVLAVAAVVSLAGFLNAEPAPTVTKSSAAAPPMAAYQPGGSVYDQQVPHTISVPNQREIEKRIDDRHARQHKARCSATTKTAVPRSSATYLPGGTLEDPQVPHIRPDASKQEIERAIDTLAARHRMAARCHTATPAPAH